MPDLPPEQQTRSQILEIQSRRLRELISEVVGKNPFWTRKYESIDVQAVQSVDDLRRLPICTKAELVADQTDQPPYGTNLTYSNTDYSRLHQTSGTTGRPMRWLDTPASWNWFMDCWECIYRLTGITSEDVFAFPFSFGPFIGFWAAFEGAGRLGNLCLPGGGMSSQARLRLIEENAATVVCCTPTYALRLAEVAAEQGIDLASGSVKKLIVAGEPGASIPATKQRIESAWGAELFDHWGMTEIGALAVEPMGRRGGLTVLEHQCIAEILDPETLEPVTPGEQGELVITNLGRLGSPLIRYRTGDLVQAATEPADSTCSFLHLEGGILGRADDMVTIRGNNVFPSSLEAILREFDAVAEYRIEVREVRSMHHLKLEIEPTPETNPDTLIGQVARTIKDRLNFQAEVLAVPVGSLPRFELKGRRFTKV
ncbi:phenylacetate--CoA ligase family protein [Thalassoroseus pseudoceratinae]|uniref:phenylacetate--CoA ligase family protein n=1 Tax=Thalassoroseus pseudoceratinae TaxID=2713176 RepID=UPI001422233C|nr:AMP-binding protein [Thalassoroseus pseudoceratinae]